ncbi:MAG TPA: PPK2 family polyphosphate kinase [Jatrophihabitantaceae bacterium]
MREALAFRSSGRVLADVDPDGRPLAPVKKSGLPKKLRTDAKRIADLQERLWAESTAGGMRRLLLVLQGIDTAGKGGVANHVIGASGPIGVQYTGFKRPTEEELRHDFLWRVRKHLPAPGVIAIFDRSHYEDVIVPLVHDETEPDAWNKRIDEINAFERDLAAHATTVVKCFLHISYDTQRDRLVRRLERPDKHWKFNVADLDERKLWPRYQEAFQEVLERTDTDDAPWYVIPSDSKKYRNWAVAQLLREILEDLDPQYPQSDLDVDALKKRLAPPN